MSNAQTANTINFQYGIPGSRPDPSNTVTVTVNGQTIVLEKDGPIQPVNNVGFFTLSVSDQFYPLSLYFDGQQFCSPELSSSNALMAKTPLQPGTDIQFTVYNQSSPDSSGTFIINFTNTDSEIGVLIVGTSGLTDPHA